MEQSYCHIRIQAFVPDRILRSQVYKSLKNAQKYLVYLKKNIYNLDYDYHL